jgi:hypothetical protein
MVAARTRWSVALSCLVLGAYPVVSGGPGAAAAQRSATETATAQPQGPKVPHGFANVVLPGSVCSSQGRPLQLHRGQATITSPPGLQAGTPNVNVFIGAFAYGDLVGAGHRIVALNVWCTNTGGTADGQIQNSWVVFSGVTAKSRLLGVLTPQQPSVPGAHVPYFVARLDGGVSIRRGRITTSEVWYGPLDGTCCPSGIATTVWAFQNDRFSPVTKIVRAAGGTPSHETKCHPARPRALDTVPCRYHGQHT